MIKRLMIRMRMMRIMRMMMSQQGCLFPVFPKVAVWLCAPEVTECPSPLNSASFALRTCLRWFSLGLRHHSTLLCTVHFAHMPVLVLQRSMSARNERAMVAVQCLALCKSSSRNCGLDTKPRNMVFARLCPFALCATVSRSVTTLRRCELAPIRVKKARSTLGADAGTPR